MVFSYDPPNMSKLTRAVTSDLGDLSVLVSSAEIIPGRLYLVVLNSREKPKYTVNSHYFTIDEELQYDPFYEDFGPLNLALLYKYCIKLNEKLHSFALTTKKIVHYTTTAPEKRVNAAYLIGSYAILYLKMSPNDVYQRLSKSSIDSYAEFRDASGIGHTHYTISLLDCLHAVYHARRNNFFDFADFSATEYEYYETVENGDLNWILPGKFLAFAGPQSPDYLNKNTSVYSSHPPESYFSYFKDNHVTCIVRLNNKLYDAAKFTAAGFEHHDLFFFDGSTPNDELFHNFLKIVEKTSGAVAVHCKAGLGRTGSMIACYIMKWYRFTAREAIAWLRICRPASIIGHQQEWLEGKQAELWSFRAYLNSPKHPLGIYTTRRRNAMPLRRMIGPAKKTADSLSRITDRVTCMSINSSKDVNKNAVICQNDLSPITQGDKLNQIKHARHTAARSATAKSLRSSWPLNSVNGTGRRAGAIGKAAPPRRNMTRNKSCSSLTKLNTDDNRNAAAISDVSSAATHRRPQKTMETRSSKAASLR